MKEIENQAYNPGPPEPFRTPLIDFPLGFEDLSYDPSAPNYEENLLQLADNYYRWIEQFLVEGNVREYIRYLIKSKVLTLQLKQCRRAEGTVLFSFELDQFRVVAYDPTKHEKQVPTVSTQEVERLLDIANAKRSLATHQHDKRTKPVYLNFEDRLTERELKLLALRQLAPESFLSSVIAEEINANLLIIEMSQPNELPSIDHSEPSDDGVGWYK